MTRIFGYFGKILPKEELERTSHCYLISLSKVVGELKALVVEPINDLERPVENVVKRFTELCSYQDIDCIAFICH